MRVATGASSCCALTIRIRGSIAGGKCEHRVGCFFSLTMNTWADALLALSVMQATANDMHKRWKAMSPDHRVAANRMFHGLQPWQGHDPGRDQHEDEGHSQATR